MNMPHAVCTKCNICVQGRREQLFHVVAVVLLLVMVVVILVLSGLKIVDKNRQPRAVQLNST